MKSRVSLLAVLTAIFLFACSPVAPADDIEEADATEDTTTTDTIRDDEAVEAERDDMEESENDEELESENPTLLIEGDALVTDSGLQYIEIEAGTGDSPAPGDLVQVHYTGQLEDGTVFDSSYDRGAPFQFPLGAGQVIAGWDEGIGLMKVGGKSTLIIPPDLGYGSAGAGGGIIPPDATLVFDVELVGIVEPVAQEEVDESDYIETESGLQYYDIVEGDGPSPEAGQIVVVHYTGWLLDGTKFDSSVERGQPFQFIIGQGQVIAGWDEGVATMKVGGKRQLRITKKIGYGSAGAGGGIIPPDATLVFDVELLEIQ